MILYVYAYGWKNDIFDCSNWRNIFRKSYHAVDWEMTIRSIDYLDRADSKSTWVIVAFAEEAANRMSEIMIVLMIMLE